MQIFYEFFLEPFFVICGAISIIIFLILYIRFTYFFWFDFLSLIIKNLKKYIKRKIKGLKNEYK